MPRLKIPKRLDLGECWRLVKPLVSKEVGNGIYTPVPYLTETSVYKIGTIFVRARQNNVSFTFIFIQISCFTKIQDPCYTEFFNFWLQIWIQRTKKPPGSEFHRNRCYQSRLKNRHIFFFFGTKTFFSTSFSSIFYTTHFYFFSVLEYLKHVSSFFRHNPFDSFHLITDFIQKSVD